MWTSTEFRGRRWTSVDGGGCAMGRVDTVGDRVSSTAYRWQAGRQSRPWDYERGGSSSVGGRDDCEAVKLGGAGEPIVVGEEAVEFVGEFERGCEV
jgi:hypothetical protein